MPTIPMPTIVRVTLTAAVATAAVALGACGPSTVIAKGVEIGPTPLRIEVKPALRTAEADGAVCFRFARPGDSRDASGLRVRLFAAGGTSELLPFPADRTGEASLCVADPATSLRTYTAVEITAPKRASLDRIDWRGSTAQP